MGFFSDFFKSPEEKSIKKASKLIQDVDLPDLQQMMIDLGRLVELGELDPEAADAILQESTGFDDIQTDPELRAAQFDALQRFQEISGASGLDAQAKSRLTEARALEQQTLQGNIGALAQSARARGVGGSGFEQQNQLLAAQSSANRAAQSGFSEAALAEQRATEALLNQANLAGGIESADFARQAEAARAQDLINQFNVGQKSSAQQAADEASRFNLGRETSRDVFNIEQANEEERSRRDAVQQEFENRFKKAGGLASLEQARGQAKATQKDRNIRFGVNVAKTAASAFSDIRLKENIEDLDVDEFLGNITGHKFNYKGSNEDKFGVMSKDLRKSKMGRDMIEVSPDGFDFVHFGDAIPGMLGSLADMNKRLKKVEK